MKEMSAQMSKPCIIKTNTKMARSLEQHCRSLQNDNVLSQIPQSEMERSPKIKSAYPQLVPNLLKFFFS